MLRLLIADDEKTIREAVGTVIDWKSLDIEVVGLCKNGLEAYNAILDEYPDIVLTDIRMPRLSGLELIRKITENHDNIQFIILSGYNDFAYAKEAMRYGIKHFLLKPCEESEIMEAVLDAAKDHYKKLSHSNMERALQKSLMSDILLQALSSENSIRSLPDIYESYLDFRQTSYELCYLYYLEKPQTEACILEVRGFLSSYAPDIFPTFIYVKNTLTFFFPNSRGEYKIMDAFFQNLSLEGQSTPSVYKRESYSSFQELLEVLSAKVKRYETISLYTGNNAVKICNYNSIFEQVTAISDSLLKETNMKEHESLMGELRQLLSSVKDTGLLRSLISNLLLRPVNSSLSYTASEITELLSFVNSVSSNKEICDILFQKLDNIYPLPVLSPAKYKPFVQEIMAYANKHLGDPNLTLKWIVENHLYMNVDYVSRQFVLQTGIKFSSYLNELRIKKAKQLLINCDSEKIYHVAEQIGCGNNPQYFSHLFKKYTNMTPKEYVQKMKK